MHTSINAVIAAGLVLVSAQTHAAITHNDLSGLAPLNAGNPSVPGISLNPLVTGNFGSLGIVATFGTPTITIAENGPDFIGFGPTVPFGTDLTSFTSPVSTPLNFATSTPSGIYYAPFYQDPFGGGAVGYLTFSYDNPAETLTLLSSTVQDSLGESLVVGVPEPASAVLGALGLGFLFLRRR